MSTRRVLVIEDERDIAELLRLHLADAGCDVTLERDGDAGMQKACRAPWDLLVLDLRLPGRDGLSICRAVREATRYVPIMMLTSRSSEAERIEGLESGADDYLTKPFSVPEFMARVRAIFRRVDAFDPAVTEPDSVSAGPVSIDVARREVCLNGRPVSLTAREFDLLLHLARHPGQVFSRSSLLDSVWGHGHDGYEHTVNSHINRLRAKVEANPSDPSLVVTVWGVGYKLDVAPRVHVAGRTRYPGQPRIH